MIVYPDASALVKAVRQEPGTESAVRLLEEASSLACSVLGYVEARAAVASSRASGRQRLPPPPAARELLDRIWTRVSAISLDESLAAQAADLAEEQGLRGADAVHLATLGVVGRPGEDVVFACWDRELASAARRLGYRVYPEL